MPKSFDLTCKKGYYLRFLIRLRIWIKWALILNPRSMEQTTCQVMSEPNFWNGTRNKGTKVFCNKQELLAYCMNDVNVLRQACCAFRNLFFKLVKMAPFPQAIKISSICNKVFRTTFQKPDSLGIIPREGYRMRERHSVEALQWLAYIAGTRNNVTHAGKGREVYLPGVQNVKVDGYCTERSLSNWGDFSMGVLVCPIDASPFATLRKHC